MLVHLVYLVYLVWLVDRTGNLSRRTRQTRKTGQPDRRAQARCTSTEDQSAPIPLSSSRWIRRHEDEDFEALVCMILHAVLCPGWRHGRLPWTQHLFL